MSSKSPPLPLFDGPFASGGCAIMNETPPPAPFGHFNGATQLVVMSLFKIMPLEKFKNCEKEENVSTLLAR
jgi:hypothetical protein